MGEDIIDNLVIAFVSGDDMGRLSQALRESGFYFTRVDSHGGFLLEEVASLLIGIPANRLSELTQILIKNCPRRRRYVTAQMENLFMTGHPVVMEGEAGGATYFVLEVERFLKIA